MYSHLHNTGSGHYKPFATRFPVLALLLALTLLLIALTEVAIRSIPQHHGIGTLGDVVNKTLNVNVERDLGQREDSTAALLELPTFSKHTFFPSFSFSAAGPSSTTPTPPPPTPTGTVTGGGYLSLGESSPSVIPVNWFPSGLSRTIIPARPTEGGGGYLSTGKGSIDPPPTGVHISAAIPSNNVPDPPTVITATATGGYLSIGDPGDTPTPEPPSGPTKNSPVQTSQTQPTPPSVTLGASDPVLVVSNERITTTAPPQVTLLSDGHTSTWTPVQVVDVAGNGQTSIFISNAPVSTSNAGPTTPVVVLIGGKTSTLAPGSQATDANGAPLPILSIVGGQTLTATPSPVLQVVDGKTSTGYLTPVLTEINGHIYTEVPSAVLTTVDGKVSTAYQTPIFTEINGHIYTETPLAIPTTVNGKLSTAYVTPILTEINGRIYTEIPVAVPTIIDGKLSTVYEIPIVTDINGHIYTIAPAGAATSADYGSNNKNEATATRPAIFPTATIVNSTGTFLAWSNGGTTWAPQITQKQYITVSFVPLILAVLYTIPWRILDTTIREMEPFYQLSQSGGAFAENSLLLDYPTTLPFVITFKSLRKGHFMVFWSSLISIVVLVLAPLSSEALFVSLSGTCGPNLPPCHASWGIYPTLARLMQGLLSFVAILLACIMYRAPLRSTGVYSEPLSIAGLASLLYKSPLLSGLREIDSLVTSEHLTKMFEGKRFGIQHFLSMDQRKCYGIVPVDGDDGEGAERGANGGYYSLATSLEEQSAAKQELNILGETNSRIEFSWWLIKEKLFYIVAFLLLSGVLCLITYYHYTWGDSGFERFMDSQAFGIRFMMTALGVVVKLFWSTIDQDFRRMSPYHRLLAGSSLPEDSILLPSFSSPFSAIIPSLLRQHYLVALISLVTTLAEFLPVCLANIAFSPAMTQQAYTISTYLSITILILMLCSLGILLFRPRASRRPLPRKPDTLASVMVYVASKEDYTERSMIDSFRGLSLLGTRERDDAVKALEGVYAMGVVEGDGLRVDDDRRVKRFW